MDKISHYYYGSGLLEKREEGRKLRLSQFFFMEIYLDKIIIL